MTTSSPPSGVIAVLALAGLLGLAGLGFVTLRPGGKAGDARAAATSLTATAPGQRPGGEPRAGDPATRPRTAATTNIEAYDPTRPGNGGPNVVLQQARATAWLERRKQPLPLCGSESGLRASGTCQTTLARNGSNALVALHGTVSIDDQGVVHVERGEATVTNQSAERVLVVVDASGRTFRVSPLGKVDVDEVQPVAAGNPPPASSAPPVDYDRKTGPPRREQPPPSGPRPGPQEPVLSPDQGHLFGDAPPAPGGPAPPTTAPPGDEGRPPPPHPSLEGAAGSADEPGTP